jgi:hypothetical protein
VLPTVVSVISQMFVLPRPLSMVACQAAAAAVSAGGICCLCTYACGMLGRSKNCWPVVVQGQQPVADAAAGAIERDTSAMFVFCFASSGVFMEMSMQGSCGLSSC